MYFKAKLSLRPTSDFIIQTRQPTKVFAKLFHTLSAGLVSTKEQAITQTALSLLQQFNMCFRSLGITNVVRIARDDMDFYLDNEGLSDDLHLAANQFAIKMESAPPGLFNNFDLTLEHQSETFKYLIAVKINRLTKVGELPISIEIFGLLNAFKRESTDKAFKSAIADKMGGKTENYVNLWEIEFNQFVAEIDMTLNKHMSFDDSELISQQRILRPQNRANKSPINKQNSSPIYHSYQDFDVYTDYTWYWLELIEENNWELSNMYLVDESDRIIVNTDEENYDDRFTDLDEDLSNIEYEIESNSASESSSWFDSTDSIENSISASSCSSCSSCGGD